MTVGPDAIETGQMICAGGMPAFFARPAMRAKRPAVIVMHERYGLVAHTRNLAVRCAEEGFVALAPDFFHKHPDKKALHEGKSRYAMSDPESAEYLRAAVAAVDEHGADPEKVAVAGYCQTGRHPVVFAAEAKIAAAVVWYGAAARREWDVSERQPKPMEELIAALDCPVFGAFGADDHIISLDDVRRFRDALERHRKSCEIHIYEGAPHGWLNDTMPGRYRQAQAEAGWKAQQKFLKSVFAGEWPATRVAWRFRAISPHDYDFSRNVRQE